MPPLPKIIAGRYEVLRELGRGGMGVVYLVQHVHTHEQSALKILSTHVDAKPETIERFRREMRAPALIKSDHVVKIMDADVAPELDGAPFYVMEYLVGCDVAHALHLRGKLTFEETVWILNQVARGLDKAHAIGIVHRDLKPGNLFVHVREDDNLVVKIFDFGLVRFTQQIGSGSDFRALTNTQSMLGTPLYMAPEQAKKGNASTPIGPPADIWAIGMLCFELLTGQTYFDWESLLQFVGQLLFAELTPPSQRDAVLPPAFDAWFARSCHRTPSERFTSAGAQIAELAQALGCDPTNLSADAQARLRQTIRAAAEKSQPLDAPKSPGPMPPPAEAAKAADKTPVKNPPAQTIGNHPTVGGPKPQTISAFPTMHDGTPDVGNASTVLKPRGSPAGAPAETRRSLRGLFIVIGGMAILGLSILLRQIAPQSHQTPQKPVPTTQSPQADLATPAVDMAAPPDLGPPRDLLQPTETFLPIPTAPLRDPPPPRKGGKRPLRPPEKHAAPPQKPEKPPEEYVHPTL